MHACSACKLATFLLYFTALAAASAYVLGTQRRPGIGISIISKTHTCLFRQLLQNGPDICSQNFPGIPLNWRAPSKVLALTFDDGPHAGALNGLLDVLKAQGVPATFFINTVATWGQPFNSQRNQGALQRLIAEGHELGSHAAEHVRLSQLPPAAAQQQILLAIGNISAITGNKSVPLFRAPYGDGFMGFPLPAPPRLRQLWATVRQHHVHIAWNFAGDDHKLGGTDPGCSDRLFKAYSQPLVAAHTAGVVLMHSTPNGMGGCPQALARLIPYWKQAGYRFVTVAHLVEQIYGMSPAAVVAKMRTCRRRQPVSSQARPG